MMQIRFTSPAPQWGADYGPRASALMVGMRLGCDTKHGWQARESVL